MVSNEYLVHFLNSKTGSDQVNAVAQGTTRLRVNVTNLKSIQIALPSLDQQAQIVDKLNLIQNAIVKVEWLNDRMKDLMNATINDLLGGK